VVYQSDFDDPEPDSDTDTVTADKSSAPQA
jgi:hypothetical protein